MILAILLCLVPFTLSIPASVSPTGELYTELQTCADLHSLSSRTATVTFNLTRLNELTTESDGTASIQVRKYHGKFTSYPVSQVDITSGFMSISPPRFMGVEGFFRTCVGSSCCEVQSFRFQQVSSALVTSNGGYSAFPSMSLGTHVSFETWLKPVELTNSGIMGTGQSTSAYSRPFILAYYSDEIYVWIEGSQNACGTPAVDKDSLNHYVITLAPTASKLYVNGVLVVGGELLNCPLPGIALETDTMTAFFPGYGSSSETFSPNSSLDSIANQERTLMRVWNSELTASQVTDLYNEEPTEHPESFREWIYGEGDYMNTVSISNT